MALSLLALSPSTFSSLLGTPVPFPAGRAGQCAEVEVDPELLVLGCVGESDDFLHAAETPGFHLWPHAECFDKLQGIQ